MAPFSVLSTATWAVTFTDSVTEPSSSWNSARSVLAGLEHDPGLAVLVEAAHFGD